MKIYLHIGIPKTGTSAIQSFLNYNREKLVQNCSCLYPNFISPYFDRGISQHNQCPLFNKNSPAEIMSKLKAVIQYSRKEKIDTVVVSCESIFESPQHAELISSVLKDYKGIQCAVVAYVRRQDHWYESAWKQWGLKNNSVTGIEDYILQNPLPWLEDLNVWAGLFGKGNIIVHPYEKEQLPHGLIHDFLSILDIDMQSFQWKYPHKNNLNENFGFNRDILEILRLNNEFYESVHDNRLFNLFSQYLPDHYMKKPFEGYSLLSPGKRLEILNNYEPINKAIAQEYMGRPDGRLFTEPWPDPGESWGPYPGLTVEKIVPIFTQMLYSMDLEHRKQLTALSREVRNNRKPGKQLKKMGSSLVRRILKSVRG